LHLSSYDQYSGALTTKLKKNCLISSPYLSVRVNFMKHFKGSVRYKNLRTSGLQPDEECPISLESSCHHTMTLELTREDKGERACTATQLMSRQRFSGMRRTTF
jgi:hypothetical protein